MSNEVGACNPDRAKTAMAVTLKLALLLAVSFIIVLALGHNIWASFFSDSRVMIKEYASMIPLLSISILFDYAQRMWPEDVGGSIYLCTFYCIEVPISFLIGIKLELYVKVMEQSELVLSCKAGT